MSYLTSSIVLALAYVAAVATFAIVAALRVGGRREDQGDDHEALASSRFTIPVSIIVPVGNETGTQNLHPRPSPPRVRARCSTP